MNKEKRTRGRPKASNPADSRLPHIRVKPEQLDTYKLEANKCDLNLSAWVRMVLDEYVTNQETLSTAARLLETKKPDTPNEESGI